MGKQEIIRKKILCLCSPADVRLKAGGEGGDGGGGQKGGRGGGGGVGGGCGGGHHDEGVDEDKEKLAGREEDHLGER